MVVLDGRIGHSAKEITRCEAETSQIEDSKNITIGAVLLRELSRTDLRE